MHTRNPAFDGLRTFACFAVIFFHAAPRQVDGGWLGVDAFFVLSGFLITTLLLDERDRTGHVALIRFYVRRLARLYPALCLAVALGALSKSELWAMASAMTYTGDLARALGHDLGPLGHTWSLAVEEQFYLAWPLAVILAGSRRAVGWIAAMGVVASLGLFLLGSPIYGQIPFSTYNSPLTRIWELFVGCALASISSRDVRFPNSLALIGAGIWVLAALLGGGQQHAWQVVAAVVGTAAIIASVRVQSLFSHVLGWAPFASIGRVSYGIYLFHYPLLGMALPIPMPAPIDVALKISVCVGLAFVSFRYIEEPARKWVNHKVGVGVRDRDLRNESPVVVSS